jgi:hypothetical protein
MLALAAAVSSSLFQHGLFSAISTEPVNDEVATLEL